MDKSLIGEEWYKVLQPQLESEEFQNLLRFVKTEWEQGVLCPHPSNVFNAFRLTPPDKVKVVIIGQDPYPSHHAHGLSFSSLAEARPYSLVQVFKEIHTDLYPTSTIETFNNNFPHNDLTSWARQGVLLLNRVLTVRKGEPKSHFKKGWEPVTEEVIKHLWQNKNPIVFMCWGKEALKHLTKSTQNIEAGESKLILKADHPAASAYGGGKFTGCKHFSMTNNFLNKNGLLEINWRLT